MSKSMHFAAMSGGATFLSAFLAVKMLSGEEPEAAAPALALTLVNGFGTVILLIDYAKNRH